MAKFWVVIVVICILACALLAIVFPDKVDEVFQYFAEEKEALGDMTPSTDKLEDAGRDATDTLNTEYDRWLKDSKKK